MFLPPVRAYVYNRKMPPKSGRKRKHEDTLKPLLDEMKSFVSGASKDKDVKTVIEGVQSVIAAAEAAVHKLQPRMCGIIVSRLNRKRYSRDIVESTLYWWYATPDTRASYDWLGARKWDTDAFEDGKDVFLTRCLKEPDFRDDDSFDKVIEKRFGFDSKTSSDDSDGGTDSEKDGSGDDDDDNGWDTSVVPGKRTSCIVIRPNVFLERVEITKLASPEELAAALTGTDVVDKINETTLSVPKHKRAKRR